MGSLWNKLDSWAATSVGGKLIWNGLSSSCWAPTIKDATGCCSGMLAWAIFLTVCLGSRCGNGTTWVETHCEALRTEQSAPNRCGPATASPVPIPLAVRSWLLRVCNTSIPWSAKILPSRCLLIREPFSPNLGWSHGGWRPVSVAASICPSWVQSPWPRSGLAPRSRGFGPNSGAVFPGELPSEPRSLDGVSCTT